MILYKEFIAGVQQPPGLQRYILHAAGILAIDSPGRVETLTTAEAALLHTVYDLLHFKLVDTHVAFAFATVFRQDFSEDIETYNPPILCTGQNWRSSWIWLAWKQDRFFDCKHCTISTEPPDVRVATTLDVGETLQRVFNGGNVCYGRPGSTEND